MPLLHQVRRLLLQKQRMADTNLFGQLMGAQVQGHTICHYSSLLPSRQQCVVVVQLLALVVKRRYKALACRHLLGIARLLQPVLRLI